MDKAMDIAKEEGYIGLYTVAQDNNLSAYFFYLNNGFRIDRLNVDIRERLKKAKSSTIFYKDCQLV